MAQSLKLPLLRSVSAMGSEPLSTDRVITTPLERGSEREQKKTPCL